ncbi:hypothetical protein CR513_21755, partial [Mucuna pruriens]
MTKQGNKENSSCKNWTNIAWRPVRIPRSISRMSSKLRSRWDGPFVITTVFPYGAVELKDEHTNNTFHVNGHRIMLFHEGPAPTAGSMKTISLMESAPPNDIL